MAGRPQARPGVWQWPFRWTAGGLLVVAGLFRAAQNMAQTTFPLLARDSLHVGAATIGSLGTVVGVTGVVTTLLVGARLATHRAQLAVGAGTAALAAALLVFASVPTAAGFAVAAVLLGLAGGATTPSLATAVGRSPAGERDRALARYTVVLSTSLAAGPLLETVLLAGTGGRLVVPFFAFSALPLLALALGLAGRRASRGAGGTVRPMPSSGDTGTAAAPVTGEETPLPTTRWGGRLGTLVATRGGRLAVTAQLLYAVPFAAVTVFGALVARTTFGTSAAGAQLGFTTFFVASLASRLLVVRHSPVQRKLRVLGASAALTVVGVALLALGGPLPIYFAAMLVLGVPHGVTFPLALALTAEASPHSRLAAANAGLFAATNAVNVVAPILLGAVAAAAGYQVMTAVVLAPVAAFTMLLAAQSRPASGGSATRARG